MFDANLSQSNTHNYTWLTVHKTVFYRATKYVKQIQNKLTELLKSRSASTISISGSASLFDVYIRRESFV